MPLVIWSAVELAMTLICVGIPTIRPLFRGIMSGSTSKNSGGSYERHNDSSEGPSAIRMKEYVHCIERGEKSPSSTIGLDGLLDNA